MVTITPKMGVERLKKFNQSYDIERFKWFKTTTYVLFKEEIAK